ncbi:MAG: hypothetical protein AAFN09_09735 [Pseudomonadota bacterium]
MTKSEWADILQMSQDEVAEFISSCRENQTLSTLMKALNIEALSGDDMAGRVLAHLGFTEAV